MTDSILGKQGHMDSIEEHSAGSHSIKFPLDEVFSKETAGGFWSLALFNIYDFSGG